MSCTVCETIIDVCAAPFDEWDEDVLGQVSDILGCDCIHAESIRRAANFDQPVDNFPHRQLALRKEDKQTATRFGLAELTLDGDFVVDAASSTAMELVLRNDQSDHSGRAVLPDSQWIDLDVVRDWILRCKTEHQDKCHEPPWLKGIETAGPELLIDVVDACVVPPMKGTPYIALSYTWGLGRNLKNTKATSQALQRPGALNLPHFAAQLPETIRNTMDLVRCLGERYLWVDALCIIQDDPGSLSRNLNQMQLIYANSTFSIMASAGCGAEFGLRGVRGVSQPRNLDMRVYELANGDKLCAKPLSTDSTGGTKYSYHQRGWTFQEWLFSRRKLVFTDGLLEWECQCARWEEHLKPNPLADSHRALRPRSNELKLTPSPSIWDFMRIAAKFNTKALTIAEDAPRAFAGIQAMLHRVHPGGLLLGLSEFFFEVFLAWSSLYSDVERRGSDPAATFREGLPSWSWMGWQGDITFPYDNEFQLTQPWHNHEQKIGFQEPVTTWFCSTSPTSGKKRSVRSEWHKYKTRVGVDANSESLSHAWSRERYDPEMYPYHFVPHGNGPEFIYTHVSDPRQRLLYPVPVLKWEDTPTLSEQMQYLICETSRAYCLITPEMSTSRVEEYLRRVYIKDKEQNTIISLTLPSSKSTVEFVEASTKPTSLELVAFAKGWSTWLGNDVVKGPGGNQSNLQDDSSTLIAPGKDARTCYFVLWVRQVNGVSYRLAVGEALASWWEGHKESQLAQVILG